MGDKRRLERCSHHGEPSGMVESLNYNFIILRTAEKDLICLPCNKHIIDSLANNWLLIVDFLVALQYKRRGSSTSDQQEDEDEDREEQDLEGTQLTMVNCTLGSSASSLNNNSGCPDEEIASPKAACLSVPALGPNG